MLLLSCTYFLLAYFDIVPRALYVTVECVCTKLAAASQKGSVRSFESRAGDSIGEYGCVFLLIMFWNSSIWLKKGHLSGSP